MTVDKVSIGKRLKYLRLAKQKTQQELAAIVAGSINYTMIGKIERGETMPSVATLARLANALKVRVSYFFGEDQADGTVLDLGRNSKKSWLVTKLKDLDGDNLALLCEVIRLLERYDRLHSSHSRARRGRKANRRATR